ncbi:MAG: hypothetical protein FWC19_06435 [Treponema sp.]|nr:hypothetical protein [Treponema sp.]MCL2272421.1 hypothetical protein [Treponema sp.]
MHESDAMLFIEIVLDGFFDRNFNLNESEDSHSKELCLDEIKQFISDKEPYWVQAKALEIIYQTETAENFIKTVDYTPDTAGAFLDLVFKRTKEKITILSERYQIEDNKDKTNMPFWMPVFP